MPDNSSSNKRIAKNPLLLYARMLLLLVVSLYTSRIVLATLGVEIVSVKSYPIHPALVHSFLLIAKADLPSLVITEMDKEVIDELKLSKVEPTLSIYASVIDFNLEQRDGIKQKYCREAGNEEKYAMFCSYINGKLCYKPTSRVMQLNIYNQFTDRSTPQRIDEVEDIWKRQK